MASKRSFFDNIGAQLRELEEEIDRLDEKSRVMEEKLKNEFDGRTKEFRARMDEHLENGEDHIDAFAHATGLEIKGLRENLARTASALKKGYGRFMDEMRDK